MRHFIDFINISQRHPGRLDPETGEVVPVLPIVDSGVVGKWGRDCETGELVDDPEWGNSSKLAIRGSFDSLVMVKCDGFTVRLEGNVGRLDRADNLFNLDFQQTIAKCNEVLSRFRLPPFTPGERVVNMNPSSYDLQHGINLIHWTGATVTELHCTQNLGTGSPENADAFVRWLSTQSMSNVKGRRTAPEASTWGSERGRFKLTAYIKHLEMLAPGHMHGRSKSEISADPVYQFARENGIVRVELKAKRLMLRDAGLRFLGDITMEKVIQLYQDKVDPLIHRVREDITRLDIGGLPSKIRMTAACYLRGEDVRHLLSTATFYRHAKALREYGIDIYEPLAKFDKLNQVIKVIEVSPVECPSWYWEHQDHLFAQRVHRETLTAIADAERLDRVAAVAANEDVPFAKVANGQVDDPDRLAYLLQAAKDYEVPRARPQGFQQYSSQ